MSIPLCRADEVAEQERQEAFGVGGRHAASGLSTLDRKRELHAVDQKFFDRFKSGRALG
jgi:hypothetical protein